MIPVLAPLLVVLAGSGALADKKLDAAAAELRAAYASGTRQAQQKALDAVVALEQPGAVAIVQAHYATASQELRASRDAIVQKTFTLERKRDMLSVMEVRAERDPSLGDVVARLRSETGALGQEINELGTKRRAAQARCDDLGDATERLFARFSASTTKKAANTLWEEAEEHPEHGVRIAAVEMLGRIGGKGTALRLHKLMAAVHRERMGKKKELPKLEAKVRKFEERYQREQDQNEGRASRASQQQYEAVKAEPAALRSELHKLAFLVSAASEAGGRSLARAEEKDLAKSLKSLVKLQGSSKGKLRLLTLDLLAAADSDAVRAKLREMLAEEDEPLARAELIDALARLRDAEAVGPLLSTYLADESWHVRSRAATALATLRSKAAIPVLIERLEADEGRVVTDVRRALESLTGERFGANAATWRRWWKDNAETFEVPEEEPEPKGSLSAEEAIGVTFFGIKTKSQRVLFVLDVSRSMNFSMVPRDNPTDDPNRDPDWPQEGEDSRLEVAKREMIKALGGIGDGGLVNIVMYATDVWSWREDGLATIDTETKSGIVRYVEALTANGGTNIFGALQYAFDLAGVEEEADDGGEWSEPLIDTVYLLSDGRASVGVTTVSDEILSYVRERNRTAGITIHTIGLSGAQDAYLLRSLAEQNGGAYAAK